MERDSLTNPGDFLEVCPQSFRCSNQHLWWLRRAQHESYSVCNAHLDNRGFKPLVVSITGVQSVAIAETNPVSLVYAYCVRSVFSYTVTI
jgi:hypothetical protein